MCFDNFSALSIWRVLMAGYYMLSTLYHLCVCECVGIMPSDKPPPAWSPSPPPGHGGRVWPKQPGGGTGQNLLIWGDYLWPLVNACHSSHSSWHLALRNFIMQIKNKLNNLIVSTFSLLFVNKIMFTKCFFSAPKVLFFFF